MQCKINFYRFLQKEYSEIHCIINLHLTLKKKLIITLCTLCNFIVCLICALKFVLRCDFVIYIITTFQRNNHVISNKKVCTASKKIKKILQTA